MKAQDINKFEKPSVTVDVILMTIDEGRLKVLLIKRGIEPFKGQWALPGGFVRIDESLEKAARRELKEEAGVKNEYLEQLYSFGEVKRDPRGRVITVAYFALTNNSQRKLKPSFDADEAQWFPALHLPKLAFDHKKIIDFAYKRLRAKISYSNIAYGLLPDKFRLSELQKVYEIILDKTLDKRNFRKWILGLKLLESTGQKVTIGASRPAELYRFLQREPVLFD